MATLGERIKQLRLEKKMTQEELGKVVGVVKSTFSMYESDKSTPSDDIKKIMTDYFGVTMDYLMGISDDRQNNKENQINMSLDELRNNLPNALSVNEDKDFNKRDLKKIEKELEKMMEGIKSNPEEGFANFDGDSNIDEDDLALLEDAFRTALRVVKKLNKETYNPKKNK